MTANPDSVRALMLLSGLLSRRADTYRAAIQTSVFGKLKAGWTNVLTKADFVCKGELVPSPFVHRYSEAVVVRRITPVDDGPRLVEALISGSAIGDLELDIVPTELRVSNLGRTRSSRSEWSSWPADTFLFEPPNGQSWAPSEALVAVDAPYFPTLGQLLFDTYGIKNPSWTSYFRGQVAIVLPDFRARIAKLIIGQSFLRLDLEAPFLQPAELVVKIYAEDSVRRLAQETAYPENLNFRIELPDKPTMVSVALLDRTTGELLDEQEFQEGSRWAQARILIEVPQLEIEQLMLTGEGETIEFREKWDSNKPQRLAKTVVAFANTRGGIIIFGISDDHRIVGCELLGLGDSITNIIRSYCDPPPLFRIEVVAHGGKQLLVVRVAEAEGRVHVVKDLGAFVRANATNRAPTSEELEILCRRRGGDQSGGWMLRRGLVRF